VAREWRACESARVARVGGPASRAIDAARRGARFDASRSSIADGVEQRHAAQPELDDESLDDDWLRLIFTCCHPALSADARIALTLREVCDLTTEQVARAFLSTAPTIAQRIVRAKAKIRDARSRTRSRRAPTCRRGSTPFCTCCIWCTARGTPPPPATPVVRADLTRESIRLGRLLLDLLPEEGEVAGLLALMLLHDSRRLTRETTSGEIALLAEQDRTQWKRDEIEEGSRLVERAMRSGRIGPYTVQGRDRGAARRGAERGGDGLGSDRGAVRRADAHRADADRRAERAVAVAMRDGADAGLALIDGILARGELETYHLAHAARADLLVRLGRREEGIAAYERALGLARLEAERRFSERKLGELRLSS
jgi:RNA polymerase sigma-70 factor (ECF subfamily)